MFRDYDAEDLLARIRQTARRLEIYQSLQGRTLRILPPTIHYLRWVAEHAEDPCAAVTVLLSSAFGTALRAATRPAAEGARAVSEEIQVTPDDVPGVAQFGALGLN